MSIQSASSTYAEQLIQCGHGLPLWEPEPSSLGETLIGDVGFVQDGCFYRLFNVLRPADDPANANGVPDGFTKLEINEALLIQTRERYLPPRPVYNVKSTQCKIAGGLSA